MTIRLLAAYDIYPQNAIVTLAAGTESGLIAAGQATATLTGGVTYVAPVVPAVINNARVSTSGGVSTIIDDAGNAVSSGAVAISGSPIVGGTLTATAPIGTKNVTYQWRRNSSDISGATSSTYVLTFADVGSTPECYVTWTGISGFGSMIAAGAAPVFAISNLKLSNTAKIRAKLKLAKSGTGIAQIAREGDSTTCGSGAGTNAGDGSANTTGAWPNAPVQKLTAAINAVGALKANNNMFCGGGLIPINYGLYNTRVTLGANWVLSGSILGGQNFAHTNATLDALTFQTTGLVDRVRVMYPKHNNSTFQNPFDVAVNGTVVGTTVTAGATADQFTVVEYSISPLTAPIITIVPKTSGAVQVCGIECYSSTADKILFRQYGQYGAKVNQFTGNAGAKSTSANDLVFISLTINDANGSTSKASYKASLDTLINQYLPTTDVILELGAVSNSAQSSDGTLAYIQAAVTELAAQYDLPVISAPTILGSTWAIANTAGYMFDYAHPTNSGYAQEAAVFDSVVEWLIAVA